jgi:hypothetical protein
MNIPTCSTHACAIEELNPKLKNALRLHGKQYELEDIESNVLMCCETRSVLQKSGLFGGTEEITFSAAYITPKWLVWANTANGNAASSGSAQLRNIETRDYESTAMFAIVPNHGLNITGRYTDVNKTGMTFISLGSEPDGQNFRHVLKEALKRAAK